MNVTAEYIHAGESPRVRLSAGEHSITFNASDPDAFDAASEILLERCAGFSKHDMLLATVSVVEGVARRMKRRGN
jgi:hypothetical protein